MTTMLRIAKASERQLPVAIRGRESYVHGYQPSGMTELWQSLPSCNRTDAGFAKTR